MRPVVGGRYGFAFGSVRPWPAGRSPASSSGRISMVMARLPRVRSRFRLRSLMVILIHWAVSSISPRPMKSLNCFTKYAASLSPASTGLGPSSLSSSSFSSLSSFFFASSSRGFSSPSSFSASSPSGFSSFVSSPSPPPPSPSSPSAPSSSPSDDPSSSSPPSSSSSSSRSDSVARPISSAFLRSMASLMALKTLTLRFSW
mmetsp:Transcript_18735/g.61334  ORF Transcript_18735/g.61334 Transcript_18735/m.61334 type:complete len:201 (-) Transcript_18735:2878-3480(-)